MNEAEMAWWLWTQIKHEAETQFVDDASLEYRRSNQQSYLVVGEQAIVVYKKLKRRPLPDGTTRLERANAVTTQNHDFWSQRASQGFPDLPRIIFGYELKEELTSIKFYLGLPKASASDLRWHEEITRDEIPVIGIQRPFVYEPSAESVPNFELVPEEVLVEARQGS